MKHILLILSFLMASSAFGGVVSKISGDVIGDFKELRVTIEVSNISKSELKADAQEADFVKHLSILLPAAGVDQGYPILSQPGPSVSGSNSFFYWKLSSQPKLSTASNNVSTITYAVSIQSNTSVSSQSKTLKDIAVSGSIKVAAQFNPYDTPTGKFTTSGDVVTASKLTTDITQIFSSPNGAPGISTTLTPVSKGLKINWSTGDVDYVPVSNPAIKQTPGQVLVMIFEPNSGPVQLDAYHAKATADVYDDSNKTVCTFTDNVSTGCISCTDNVGNGVWVSEIQNNPLIKTFTLTSNNGSKIIKGLTPDSTYTVVLQYKQGVQQSACVQGTPFLDYSMTEANGGDEAKEGDPRCFIVSAAFGSPFNKHVDIFRWFRDEFLEPFRFGHEFVEFYYEHSQPFADLVKSSPFLQTSLRIILYPLAFFLYALQESIEYPALVIAGMLLMAFFLVRRRRLAL